MMDNEVVEVLYTCIKNAKVEFEDVAREPGLKNAATAFVSTEALKISAGRLLMLHSKSRLTRVMKTQEKDSNGPVNNQIKATKPKLAAEPTAKGSRKAEEGVNGGDVVNGDADGDDGNTIKNKGEDDDNVKDEPGEEGNRRV
jgi:hypothetical protein